MVRQREHPNFDSEFELGQNRLIKRQLSSGSVRYSELVSVIRPHQLDYPGSADPDASCGYNVTNLQITNDLGCIYRGWQYQLPANYFGFTLPDDISKNLSKVIVTTVVGKPSLPLYVLPQS